MNATNEVYVTCRQQFIRDFMIQTQRPVSELASFLVAFNSCGMEMTCPDVDVERILKNIPTSKKKPKKEPQVIHEGNKPNKHPRAKMVAAEFEGRIDYYGSIAAAAQRLNVTVPQLQYALKHKKLINGISVITVSPEEAFQMKGKEV